MLLEKRQKVVSLGCISGGHSSLHTFLLLNSLIQSSQLSLARIPSEFWWKNPLRTALHLTVFFLLLVSGCQGRFPFPRKNLYKNPRVGKFKKFHYFPHIILCVNTASKQGKNEGKEKGLVEKLDI